MNHNLMTGGAPFEDAVAQLTKELDAVKQRLRSLFQRDSVADTAGKYLDALMGDAERKTSWARAEAVGDPTPRLQQALLGRRTWEADELRDLVREYVLENFADDDAVLVADETGFPKQGDASCGVARQYCGTVGKIANCQIGVFLTLASSQGHAFIDRQLYLPKEWTDRPGAMAMTYVPSEVGFKTKCEILEDMLDRAIENGVPFAYVAADSVYGVNAIEVQLRKANKGYVLGVRSNRMFELKGKKGWKKVRCSTILKGHPEASWSRLASGEGTKGPRWHDWIYIELPDRDSARCTDTSNADWTRGLLVRRDSNKRISFFVTWSPKDTPMEKLIEVEGKRWTIEESFATAKSEFGLDHNETRSYHGWHRHITLSMLVFAMASIVRYRANSGVGSKKKRFEPDDLIHWSIQEMRHVWFKLTQRQLPVDYILAWCIWRRRHQAEARECHVNRNARAAREFRRRAG